MLSFGDFVHPLSEDEFLTTYYGRRPVHIPAAAGSQRARGVLDWGRFNQLLAIRSHWTDQTLKMVMNGRPVLVEHYCDPVETAHGTLNRANPAKVDVFAAMGASIVANDVQEISGEIAQLAEGLGRRLAGRAGANIYCSFQGVQAFGAHYDLHEVFALQCEGEKVWRLYQSRADNPLDPPPFTDEARQQLDREKGPLMFEVRARPGDVIYIPRGWFHDALASSEASLHLTLSVTPHSARAVMPLLEAAATQTSLFRAYLPDHRQDGGAGLRQRLAELADQFSAILRSEDFFNEVAAAQRERSRQPFSMDLPAGPRLEWLRNTGRPVQIARDPAGSVLKSPAGDRALGVMRGPAEWALGRPALTVQELIARYPQFTEQELRALVGAFLTLGVLEPMAA